MKAIFTILIVLLFGNFNAQSFQIKLNGALLNDSSLTIGSVDSVNTIETLFSVFNTSPNLIEAKVKRIELNPLNGTKNYFCWFQCYSEINAGVPEWPSASDPERFDFLSMDPGKPNDLTTYIIPNNTSGSTSFRYVVFNSLDTTDSAFFDINYELFTVGIKENVEDNGFEINVDNTSINVLNSKNKKNYELHLFDMLGNKLNSTIIKAGHNEIRIENYSKGLYFYTLSNLQSPIKSNKFFIQ